MWIQEAQYDSTFLLEAEKPLGTGRVGAELVLLQTSDSLPKLLKETSKACPFFGTLLVIILAEEQHTELSSRTSVPGFYLWG